MSFEKHHIVAPFLAIYKNGHSGFNSKEALYEGIAKALQAKLQEYEEEAALEESEVTNPAPMMYKTLKNATARGDWEAVNILSQAIQRINFQ